MTINSCKFIELSASSQAIYLSFCNISRKNIVKIFLNKISLAKKITFMIFVTRIATSMSIVLYAYYFVSHLNKDFLNNELKEHQAIIKLSYVAPLLNSDKAQIEEVTKALLFNSGYAYMQAIRVVSPKGEVLFQSSKDSLKSVDFNYYQNRPNTKIMVDEITKNGKQLGKVFVVFSTETLVAKFKEVISKVIVAALLIVILFSVVTYFFFTKMITRPLNELLDHIRQLRNEKYDPKEYSDLSFELRLIANALNFTSSLIKKRNDELKNQADVLEKIVHERTCELENQILKNVTASRLAAVGEVASGIAHEINNPLTVINGQVLKIKRQIKDQDRKDIEAPLDKITLMSERIVKIINGLKLISRDGGSDPMSEFSLFSMIDEIKLLTEMKIKVHAIDLEISMPSSLENVCGREVQISQVLVNLINNAVDAISLNQEKWIKVEVIDLESFIQVRVTDSGNGIPKELQEKIMNPFFTTKEVGKGTGLGLSISKGIIKDHGGEFFYNDAHPNTQFVFTLKKRAIDLKAA